VRVPSLKGERFDEAEGTLEDLGLEAEEQPRLGALGRRGGWVVEQSHGPGSMVDRGTTIVLQTL
jgi:beta-lactam-binding protein with PASTA domain